jgi:hypothetical protein
MNSDFWDGVIYACEYFRDELGIEDAMETSLAQDALNLIEANRSANVSGW